MIVTYVRNPWETTAVTALAIAGAFTPYALAAAGVAFCALEIVAGVRGKPGPRWWGWWPRVEGTVTVLYDATCGLCARSKAQLERWGSAEALRFLPLQSDEARALVPGMDEKAYLGAMHVVEDGKVHSAEEGWFRLMRLAPWPLALASRVIPRALARPVYAWIARNRYRWFGRVCDADTCKIHPGAHEQVLRNQRL